MDNWWKDIPGARHLLHGRLPFGADFAEHIGDLVAKLPVAANIPANLLDYTENSLQAVDAAVDRIGESAVLESDLFPCLVAYVTETVRRESHAKIEMRLAIDGETWEPHVVNAQADCQPYLTLYVQLTDHGEDPRSIYGAVSTDILALTRER